MSDVSGTLVIAAFSDKEGAEAALSQLKAANKGETMGIQAALAMYKDATGKKISYKEVGLTPGKGALGGVILGATVGILSGGTGLVLGAAGALFGGLMGRKKQESRFSADRINQVATSLEPGSSAIVAVVDPEFVAPYEQELAGLGADVFAVDISADIAKQLEEHRDAVYDALLRELDPPS